MSENFTPIPHSLMRRKDLTDQDKMTLGVILSFITNDKQCFIGNQRLGDMLGITSNAASNRIQRLQKLGIIKLRLTYKEGKKEVDKRYIEVLTLTPDPSSTTQEVWSDRPQGIVPQTTGMVSQTTPPSSKLGGIIQPFLLDKGLDKSTTQGITQTNIQTNTQATASPVEDRYKRKTELHKIIKEAFADKIPNIIKLVDINDLERVSNTYKELWEQYQPVILEYQSIRI